MTEYYITSTKYSLQERETKKHGRVYDVVFRVTGLDGVEKQKKLSGYTTKALAKKAYTDFVTQKCELVTDKPTVKKDADKNTPTVGELYRQYLASLGNQNKESVIYDKQNVFELFILSKYAETKITALTRDELYRWQDTLWSMKNPRTGDYYAYAYVSKVRTYFNTLLKWTESRYGYVNHFAEVDKPKRRAPKTEMKFWTREQFERFISVVDDPMYHCFFSMLFYTGRRYGEVVALTPEDVRATSIRWNKSVTRKTIDGSPYKVTSTKSDKSQEVELCPAMQRELANYTPQEPFFFNGDSPLHDKTVSFAFAKYCARAGVEQIRLHDLRHSFVSMLIHLGANYMVVADLIGDKPEQIMKTYGHMYDDDRRAIIAQIV